MNNDSSMTIIMAIVLILLLGGGFLAWHTVTNQQMARAMAEEAAMRAEAERATAMAAVDRARVSDQPALANKAAGEAAAADAHAPLVHTVIIYLKKDAPATERDAMIADCHQLLTKIPTVRHMSAGKPVDKDTGKFVVKDYQVALCFHFDDVDGLLKYIDHPQHKEFVAKHEAFIADVKVYDFVDEAAKPSNGSEKR